MKRPTLYVSMTVLIVSALIQPYQSQSTNGCLCKVELEKQSRIYLASFIESYSSCAEIRAARPLSPSGVYTLHYEDQTSEEVYCFMGTLPGCGEGGWRRIGYLDMTDPDQTCPSQLSEFIVAGSIRACTFSGTADECVSFFFSPNGTSYTRVCASVRGYSINSPDTFTRFVNNIALNMNNIDRPYLDGVSFTYGNPRNHLWSYAAGAHCPKGCTQQTSNAADPPPFVGDNYYCEEGLTPYVANIGNGNALWDGENCVPNENQNGCCDIPNMPWFHRTIPNTTEQIEMRHCRDEGSGNEQVPVDQYQIYIQ